VKSYDPFAAKAKYLQMTPKLARNPHHFEMLILRPASRNA